MYEINKDKNTNGYVLTKKTDNGEEVIGVFSKRWIAEQEKYCREHPERMFF